MKESEWMRCKDPERMLEFLRGRASDRKIWLFAVAYCRKVWRVHGEEPKKWAEVAERYVEGKATWKELNAVCSTAPWWVATVIANMSTYSGDLTSWEAELDTRAEILRDIFGPRPFRIVRVNPSWLRWNNGTVPHLARSIYEDRRFTDLPILADALEEAGCTDPGILGHCRSGGEHVRGCWCLDLVLNKE